MNVQIRYGYGMDTAYPPPSKRPKNYSTAGKTAAMILNELYPEFKDQCNYRTVYACMFVIGCVEVCLVGLECIDLSRTVFTGFVMVMYICKNDGECSAWT